MANSIALAKTFVPLLDEVYKTASVTSVLDGSPELVRMGANVNELTIPKLSMQGLGSYSRNGGYVSGDVTLTHETVQCNFDRGRMFSVDALDDDETAGIAFGRLAGEFIRTKVGPELDAFRFACYAGAPGISKAASGAALSSGEDAVAAIRAGQNALDEDEVPLEDRYLFITPPILGYIQDMETTKSREVLDGFAGIVRVPQTRFYTGIVQYDGSTEGQEAGGYAKAPAVYAKTSDLAIDSDKTYYTLAGGVYSAVAEPVLADIGSYYEQTGAAGLDINFMIVHKSAVIQYQKHVAPKIIDPGTNQSADAWKFGYRTVGVADVYENKTAGIYLHHKAS
ncbi:MAG: hypothetical protein IKD79_01745 [Oscillospiraceae bacterium]|nr:hypothetical protein [Oscillospiraceae bacterium]